MVSDPDALGRRVLQMRRAAWFIVIASALLLQVLAALALVVALLRGDRDPFDRFEVIAIEAEQGSGRYAVTYRYHHADSSSDVHATWVLSVHPSIGSTQPPSGRAEPVLVWTNAADVIVRRWTEGQLVVTVAEGTDRRAGRLSDCYFEYDSAHLVCFDPRVVRTDAHGNP
jgi:hypothetical protein